MFGNRSTGTGVSRLQSNFRGGGATGQGRFAGMGLADATQGFTVGGRREGLVGGNDVQTFMGGLASGMAMGGLQGGGRGGFQQGRGGRGNQQQNNQGRNNGRGGRQQRQVRTVIDVGFSMPPRNQSAIATTVAQRLAQSRGVEARSPVTVTMSGRVAVLSGVVPTDHARNLAEQLALLEPGVSRVQNDLTIAEESSENADTASATAVPPPAARPPAVAPPVASPPPPADSSGASSATTEAAGPSNSAASDSPAAR
jgi:osmotically-inducible protein OsmY